MNAISVRILTLLMFSFVFACQQPGFEESPRQSRTEKKTDADKIEPKKKTENRERDDDNNDSDDDFDQDREQGRSQNQVTFNDPGTGPWQVVSPEQMADECKLDYQTLKSSAEKLGKVMAVVRYGKMCFQYAPRQADLKKATFIHSVTKTLASVTFGVANKDSGRIKDTDAADDWVSGLAAGAKLQHVLGMTAHTSGLNRFSYDTVGSTQINKLSAAIAEATGMTTMSFAQKRVFDPLGFEDSSWMFSAKNFATGWTATIGDMARLGLLINNHGKWQNKSLMDEEYAYKMIHPQNPEANAGYGYLVWLLGDKGWMSVAEAIGGGIKKNTPSDSCAPTALIGCEYGKTCTTDKRPLDVGVWYGAGTGGQVVVGHPGLDLVMAVKDLGTMGSPGPKKIWDAVKPSLVKLDPKYKGDMKGFCQAYGANRYAPDYKKWSFED